MEIPTPQGEPLVARDQRGESNREAEERRCRNITTCSSFEDWQGLQTEAGIPGGLCMRQRSATTLVPVVREIKTSGNGFCCQVNSHALGWHRVLVPNGYHIGDHGGLQQSVLISEESRTRIPQ